MGVLEGKIKFEGSVGEEKKCSFDVENMPGGDVPEIPDEQGSYMLVIDENGNKSWVDISEALTFLSELFTNREAIANAANIPALPVPTGGPYDYKLMATGDGQQATYEWNHEGE